MKALLLSSAFFCSGLTLLGQTLLSNDEALKQLYRDYDPATKTAQWVCQKDQTEGPQRGWPCTKDATVSVSVILSEQVSEGDATRLYIVTSAKPANDPAGDYNCHACAPGIGAAVFVWQGYGWTLESENAAVDFLGGWGDPPTGELIATGPKRHGILFSSDDEAQGFSWSSKHLAIPINKGIEVVWGVESESDDADAVDPDDKENSPPLYRSSATIRFVPRKAVAVDTSDYYDIEVVSHGTSWEGGGHRVKPENWTEIYTFKGGKYRLLSRTVLPKVGNAGKNQNH